VGRLLAVALLAASLAWVLAWVAARALIVEERLPRADAVLVLAGAPVYGERLEHAASLFRDGRAPLVLLTDDGSLQSWSRTLQRNPLSVERGVMRLVRAGVPTADIDVLPGRVTSTVDEAARARRYAEAHGLKTVLVVTSMYHTRRALWTVRRAFSGSGVRIGIEPAAPTTTPSPGAWLVQARGWPMVAGEYVKLLYYWLRYA
jgi:uncharacterized SAM-binding protein YcdF (DUF218 family)